MQSPSLYGYSRSCICYTLLLVLLSFTTTAQDVLWEKSYGGSSGDYLYDAQPTPDYGFILVGSSLSKRSGNKTENNVYDLDYWIWKMDENGDLEWQKNYGGQGSDRLMSVHCTTEGGFILAGTSDSPQGEFKKEDSRGQEDLWVIRLKPDGSEQWQRTIGGNSTELVNQVIQTKDGGFILAGASSSKPRYTTSGNTSVPRGEKKAPHYGHLDYWVVKLDTGGEVEWEKTYGGIYKDVAESILQTEDEGYLIGGYSNSPQSETKSENSKGSGGDYWLLKLDKFGTIEWERTLGGDGDEHLYVLQAAKEGGYIAGGSSSSGTNGIKTKGNGKGIDFWVLKLNEYGEIDWQQTYDFGKTDVVTSIVENEDGTLLIGGYAQSEQPKTIDKQRSDKEGINDYVALKTDEEGEEKWRKVIGSSGRDVLRKMVETRDGGYVLAGTSDGRPSRDKNTGKGQADFWVVKLRDKDKEEDVGNRSLEAYPNPASAFTNVLVNHDFEEGSATVYDIGGKQLQHFPITSRTVPINISNYPVGVYIIKIATDVKTESVKILKTDK